MKLLCNISGSELIAELCRKWGYRKVHQVGSHIILETDEPAHQRMAVPITKTSESEAELHPERRRPGISGSSGKTF